MQPRFRWTCSFRGIVEYEVLDATGCYRVETRRRVLEGEAAIYNGTADAFARDVVASVGLLHRCYRSDLPIPAETVAAFNAWRQAEHDAFMAQLDGNPDRYGVLAAEDPLRVPPPPVTGARYEIGTGWIQT